MTAPDKGDESVELPEYVVVILLYSEFQQFRGKAARSQYFRVFHCLRGWDIIL